MSIADIKTALASWIETATGLTSHWSDQNARPPAVPYVSLDFISLDGFGQDWVDTEANTITLDDAEVEDVDPDTDTLTITGHAYTAGMGPVRATNTGGALPAGLDVDTDYWIIVDDADTIRLASSHYDARHGAAVDITDAGTGTHTIVDTASTTPTADIRYRARGMRTPVLSVQCFGSPAIGAALPYDMLEAARLAAVMPAVEDALNTAGIGISAFDGPHNVGEVYGDGATFEPRAVMTVMMNISVEALATGGSIEFVRAAGTVAHKAGPSTVGPVWMPGDPTE